MAQYHVKNEGFLAKAFKVKGGHQVVPAGKSADVLDAKELTEAQIDAFARDKVKVIVKGKAKAEKPRDDDQPKSAAEVLDLADGNFMAFKAAASKVLGDDTPPTKDEIIAALKAKAEA
ncbi:hypothetical protein [Pelagibacterium lacus]|uniref:Uncharacterized protein n=1 Tax=Pelagibacterium lacus TaxID=2282655 RepID=A0A369W115_9HYPH|nr:hypothetical protein [Pelagibacterium lacus]RDE07729.1 hypothetical protein DVH29_15280 [Pelagibacterium lacus]